MMEEETWKIDLAQSVEAPLYGDLIDWLGATNQGRNVVYDFWARGGFTQRLLYQRQSRIEPLSVLVGNQNEMRWAYQRLMLLGMPVDFIYSGPLQATEKLVWVGRKKGRWGGGWGYIATQWKDKGHYNAMLVGTARLMPDDLIDWVVDEVADEFISGNIFVAPAELIGINPQQSVQSLEALNATRNGTSIIPSVGMARALLEVDLPFIDQMSNRNYRKFVADHEPDLYLFRRAFRKLILLTPGISTGY